MRENTHFRYDLALKNFVYEYYLWKYKEILLTSSKSGLQLFFIMSLKMEFYFKVHHLSIFSPDLIHEAVFLFYILR